MANPGQTGTIQDPGLGVTPDVSDVFLVMGTCSSGTVNTLYSYSRPQDVIAAHGRGPAVDDACAVLAVSGRVLFMRLTGSVAGASGAVTAAPVDSATGTITVAGAAYNDYDVRVEIMSTGTLGAGTFRYSLDASSMLSSDQWTWSETLTIPSGADYVIPNTGLTLTFVPGAGAVYFEDGDVHTFTATAPGYSTTNLASGMTAVLAATDEFAAIILSGKHATGSAAATMFAALATHLESLRLQGRYGRAMMDAGGDSASNVKTAFASQSDSRVAIVYGNAAMTSSNAINGSGTPRRPAYVPCAVRAVGALLSEDLGRVKSGSLRGVVAISHDEEKNNQGLDDAKIGALRTHQGAAGFYVNNARLKSAAGSDFEFWQHGRIMDVACTAVFKKVQQLISSSVRVNTGTGSIIEKDAVRIEEEIQSVLEELLFNPKNAEGTKGHISAKPTCRVDRENNILSTKTLLVTFGLTPLGYIKQIDWTIGFTLGG